MITYKFGRQANGQRRTSPDLMAVMTSHDLQPGNAVHVLNRGGKCYTAWRPLRQRFGPSKIIVGDTNGNLRRMRMENLTYTDVLTAVTIGFVSIDTRAHRQRTITHGILKQLASPTCCVEVQRTIVTACSLARLSNMYDAAREIGQPVRRRLTMAALTRCARTHRGVRPDGRVTVMMPLHPRLTKACINHAFRHVLQETKLLPTTDIDWLLRRTRVHVRTGPSASDILCNVTRMADEHVEGAPRA